MPEDKAYGFDKLMLDMIANKEEIQAYPFDGYWLDIGRPDDYEKAGHEYPLMKDIFQEFIMARKQKLTLAGKIIDSLSIKFIPMSLPDLFRLTFILKMITQEILKEAKQFNYALNLAGLLKPSLLKEEVFSGKPVVIGSTLLIHQANLPLKGVSGWEAKTHTFTK